MIAATAQSDWILACRPRGHEYCAGGASQETPSLASDALYSFSDRTPTSLSFSWPSWKTTTDGMASIPILDGISWLSSVLNLPTLTFPSYSPASFSMVGARDRQAPHQGAQKSTKTRIGDSRPSAFQSETENSFTPPDTRLPRRTAEVEEYPKVNASSNCRLRSRVPLYGGGVPSQPVRSFRRQCRAGWPGLFGPGDRSARGGAPCIRDLGFREVEEPAAAQAE